SDHVFVRRYALALVELRQLVGRLEGAVFVDRLRPDDVLRSGDVATALRPFLWQVFGREQLAGVFSGRADVDERALALLHLVDQLHHLVPQRSDRLFRPLDLGVRRSVARSVGAQFTALVYPLLTTTVHKLPVDAVVLDDPQVLG